VLHSGYFFVWVLVYVVGFALTFRVFLLPGKGDGMATTTFPQVEEGILPRGFVRLSEAYRLLHPSDAPAAHAPEPDAEDGNWVSPSTGLLGAKAALAAIGLEAYAALCIYIIWRYFGLFR